MDDSPGRREASKFEPPPWEREQFEELQRLRTEEERGPEAEEPQAAVPDREQPGEVAESAAVAAVAKEKPTVDEAETERMLAILSVEEPPTHRGFWRIGLAASAFLVVLGGVLMIWGIVGLMRTIDSGPAGVLGGSIMITMGAGFISIGAWTAYRSLQQRGVL
ncbi:MAG: hypothetical protein Q8K99_12605 [Actinomycetota bacterium]|nr:hypothetical protein [Actinomycetota bacterium]